MKRFYLLLVFSSLAAYILLTGYGAGPATAAMNHFIGAPGGTGTTCGTCHGSPGSYGAITTSIDVFEMGTTTPAIDYLPGSTYDVVVEVLHPIGSPSRFGFQCVSFDSGGAQAGSFANPMAGVSVVPLASGVEVVEHSSFNTSAIFTFQWVAPAPFTGTVTLWAGGAATNGNGQNTGDGGSTTPTFYNLDERKGFPIELGDFTARQAYDKIVLEWFTLSELENSHFDIEHADESLNFTKIGEINGAGTTTQSQQYRFSHDNAARGINHYYRLKQVDFDGTFTYTDVVNVYMEANINQISVYPIPATRNVTVLLDIKKTGFYTQTVTDINGKVLLSEKIELSVGEQAINLDIENWPGGHYTYHLNNGQDRFSTSIVKF